MNEIVTVILSETNIPEYWSQIIINMRYLQNALCMIPPCSANLYVLFYHLDLYNSFKEEEARGALDFEMDHF